MRRIPFFQKKRSGDLARKRLKLLLVSDKVNCSPEIMEMIKDDIIHVISKYLEIDDGSMEVGITSMTAARHQEAIPALYANIPIRDLSYKGT